MPGATQRTNTTYRLTRTRATTQNCRGKPCGGYLVVASILRTLADYLRLLLPSERRVIEYTALGYGQKNLQNSKKPALRG